MIALRYLPIFLIAILACPVATAQTATVSGAEELQRIVTEAQQSGAKVVIVQAQAPVAPTDASRIDPRERAMQFRNQFAAILADAKSFPGEAVATIRGQDAEGSFAWPVAAVLLAVVFLAVGGIAERYFRKWGRSHFLYLFNPTPRSRAEKVFYLLVRGLMMFVGLVLQLAVAVVLVAVFASEQEHVRNTQLLVIAFYGGVRALSIFFLNLLAPDTPSHRMLYLRDEDANTLYRGLKGLFLIGAILLGVCVWMDMLELQRSAHKLSLTAAMLVAATLGIAFFIWPKRALATMIMGADEQAAGVGRRLLAKNAHTLLAVYFALAWCIATYRIVLDLPNATGLIGGPLLFVFAGIAGYGVAVLLIELAWTRRQRRAAAAPTTADESAGVEDEGEPAGAREESETAPWTDEPIAGEVTGRRGGLFDQPSAFKLLFERAAGVVVAVITLWAILQLWGLDLAESGFLNALWEIILISFLAYLAYSAVNIVIDQKIAEEGGGEEAAEHGDEGGGGGSRLGTLLPIFRNFLLVVIVVMAAMVALSELGVDIAPLFAGAGVVGLAVGFGAQTLIADIFSGAFFLIDDAFRKGEYIDIGSVKGTVEKISIRSMQLRHHRGPLHTIPFSQIAHLTNYSRDWAIMKLPLRLTYDTDPEKVRKLIKKLGQELLEHPEFGGDFLQPLKSQGVYQMEDSAMIFRVKFMTKPGHQFTIRKEVYRRIRELFEQEGIKFAHREVTVRVADAPRDQPLTQEQKEAVAGAVQPLLDPEQPAATATDDR